MENQNAMAGKCRPPAAVGARKIDQEEFRYPTNRISVQTIAQEGKWNTLGQTTREIECLLIV